MNSLSQTDHHRLKWLLGQILALIAFWAMLYLDFGSQPLILLFGSLIFITLLFPGLPGRIPALFWKAMTPALILIIALDFLLHGEEFLRPLVRMVMLLAVYRCLQYRNRREDLQLVLLCLFILVIAGVMTVSLAFGVQMFLFTPLAMVLLFVLNLLESTHGRKLVREDWKGFRWLAFLRRIRQSIDYRLIGFTGLLFVGVVTVSSLIFVAIPRFRLDQALPFLQMPGTGMTGFSDMVRYGDVSRLQNDDRIALRVETPENGSIPANPYWRMVVLDEYTEQGFRVSLSVKRNEMEFKEGWNVTPLRPAPDDESEGDWVVYMEGNVSEYLPLLGPHTHLRFQKMSKYQLFPRLKMVALDAVSASRFAYSVRGMNSTGRIAATQDEILEFVQHEPLANPMREDENIRNLKYPETTRVVPWRQEDQDYLAGIVQEITGGEPMEAQRFIPKALAWLHEHYRYSRNLREVYMHEGDPLMLWMQHDTQGWCEHFAGAFALISRAAGFPSRVVAGFAGAEWNGYEDYLVVRNSNAHAWVEIYDLNGHWLRVDPTPAQGSTGPDDISMQTAAALGTFSGWQAWLDSIRMIWYRRVISFDEGDQARLAENVKSYSEQTYAQVRTWVRGKMAALKEWFLYGWNREKVIQICLAVAASCGLLLGLKYLYQGLQALMRRRGKPMGRHGAGQIRRRAGVLLGRIRVAREHAQSEPTDIPEAQECERIYHELLALRFGESVEWPTAKNVFRQARRLLRSARRQGWT
ncbi:DUF3488 and transglutaminase-like domain-containing protein [Ruficoccus sp. ZRK36]|uniref:DUF3488 and transglutaminase-like domain-containing protein n=1 Tax=Ruficoccus sp. ZRK36 TaxID=2866311 RepID=UPI001C7304F4|nr:DUF3488 and transglutaminase-like domain-containing protein [Ruficoccus sp. ZRK36]QYY37194.1 DUF3488 and transglutaminase-like domain-containing protein [Ruficoccus sp. ZRK36]